MIVTSRSPATIEGVEEVITGNRQIGVSLQNPLKFFQDALIADQTRGFYS